jgi:hypothetical protein
MMMRFTPLILGLVMLSGCSGSTANFPSLAKRAIESRSDDVASMSAPIASVGGPVDASTLTKAAAAVRRAEDAASAFQSALGPAQSAVNAARGASFGSERWIEAQIAVSALERSRLAVKTALSDIDDLQGALVALDPTVDVSALALASARVAAIDDEQATVVDSLLAKITNR